MRHHGLPKRDNPAQLLHQKVDVVRRVVMGEGEADGLPLPVEADGLEDVRAFL